MAVWRDFNIITSLERTPSPWRESKSARLYRRESGGYVDWTFNEERQNLRTQNGDN
jgi:hypothetical protein